MILMEAMYAKIHPLFVILLHFTGQLMMLFTVRLSNLLQKVVTIMLYSDGDVKSSIFATAKKYGVSVLHYVKTTITTLQSTGIAHEYFLIFW